MSKRFARALCWIRRDLRLTDNAALALATSEADQVAVVFVFDTVILGALEDGDDRRLTFIHRSLRELDEKLRERGSKLVVLHGDPIEEIPKLACRLDAEAVYAGRDYDPYAVYRDDAVKGQCRLVTIKDIVIFEGGEILGQLETPYRTYTPYARAWRNRLRIGKDDAEHGSDLAALWPGENLEGELPSLAELGFAESDLWLDAGEEAARKRLAQFSKRIPRYATERDFPSHEATSWLSVHLRFGTIGIRACIREALAHGEDGDKWLSELIWRDFYQDILANHPHVVQEPFQAQYKSLDYPGSEDELQRWCEGKTGFPLVDAAMRCFNATGWMHNRLRMLVASFLTKDLLVDYRKGEAYFARHLLDFELASNNGGWQWAASVGCDAQPYFRIFNPVLQSRKFDPKGDFIRRWLPELADLKGDAIHWPHEESEFDLLAAGVDLGRTYPRPIVDHATQRDLAIKLLESAAKGRGKGV